MRTTRPYDHESKNDKSQIASTIAKVKVAYIVSVRKGMESFIFREIVELKKQCVDIVVYATKFVDDKIYTPPPHWEFEKIRFSHLPGSAIKTLIAQPGGSLSLWKEAVQYRALPELLIAMDYSSLMQKAGVSQIHCHFGDRKFFIGYFCKRLIGIPLTLTVHAHELYANPNERLFARAVHFADRIMCISERNRELLISKHNVDPELVRVIRLSVDLDTFKKKDQKRILTVARYTERKGFRELFEAIRILDDPQLQFVTIGFGDLDVRALSKEYGVQERVIVFDKMDPSQLSFMYNACDIFCLPSKTTKEEGAEGIPVTLMEAMASEMVIVTTRNGSIPELVDEILVDESDAVGIEGGIRRAVKMLDAKRNIGALNRKRIVEQYSYSNIEEMKKFLFSISGGVY